MCGGKDDSGDGECGMEIWWIGSDLDGGGAVDSGGAAKANGGAVADVAGSSEIPP